MTDGKGAGEGPYDNILAANKEWCIFACPACAYAEGRKAERDRCLAIINQCRPRTDHGWLKFCEEIEKGCQDGK